MKLTTFAIFDRKLKAPLFACADRCKRLAGIIGAKCDTREILSGRRYPRSKNFPQKSVDPRPIPIPGTYNTIFAKVIIKNK
jgi:hypothetical protein